MKHKHLLPITFCALLLKFHQSALRHAENLRFRIGFWLLVINVPFGYFGLLVSGLIAGARKDVRWLYAGSVCYGFSWVMLGAGTVLLGRQAKQMLVHDFRRKYLAWSRLRQRRSDLRASA
ncbi:MAG: hypothetical protein GX945_11420 [Lentisphaerae bacterium]|jgi:hypothetical protein|nr:hypothetical protein [Lentisphaerota bacterium]